MKTGVRLTAYLNFENMKNYIKTIFAKYGKDFMINFKQWKDEISEVKLLSQFNN